MQRAPWMVSHVFWNAQEEGCVVMVLMQDGGQTPPTPAENGVAQGSDVFIGRWNRLVSTTNWEKGRIVQEWRTSLMEAGAPPSEYADEAWASRVGNVSPQHVGRLRRVFDRFGATFTTYEGLFWSHFLAALDWDDAEMWLEGAVQNGWSVSQTREQRWQAHGASAEDQPQDADIVNEEAIEETAPFDTVQPARVTGEAPFDTESDGSEGSETDRASEENSANHVADADFPGEAAIPTARPFADLPDLPADLQESFENCKLAILRHKLDHWSEVSADSVLAHLDALKLLAATPPQ